MGDINNLHEHLTRKSRHPLGRGGTYHLMGLVSFIGLKWLNKIRPHENDKYTSEAFYLPVKYSKATASNNLLELENKDHTSKQSRDLNTTLLIHWSKLYIGWHKLSKEKNYKLVQLQHYLF